MAIAAPVERPGMESAVGTVCVDESAVIEVEVADAMIELEGGDAMIGLEVAAAMTAVAVTPRFDGRKLIWNSGAYSVKDPSAVETRPSSSVESSGMVR